MTFDVDLGAVHVVGRDDARAALADRLSKLVEAVVVDLVRSMREAPGGCSRRVILSSLNPTSPAGELPREARLGQSLVALSEGGSARIASRIAGS